MKIINSMVYLHTQVVLLSDHIGTIGVSTGGTCHAHNLRNLI